MQRYAKLLFTSRTLLDHHRVPGSQNIVRRECCRLAAQTNDLEYLGYLPSILDYEQNIEKKRQLKVLLQQLQEQSTKTYHP